MLQRPGKIKRQRIIAGFIALTAQKSLRILCLKGQKRRGHVKRIEPVADPAEVQHNGIRRFALRTADLRGLPHQWLSVKLGQRAACAALTDDKVALCAVVDKIIKRDIGRRQNVHAGDAARSGDLRLPHHAPLPVERRVARGHAAVELHGDDGQLRLVQIAAQRADKLRKAGKIGLRCVFVALGLALVPEHGLRVQLVICKLLNSEPFSSGFHQRSGAPP